jgi:hypothetical protein
MKTKLRNMIAGQKQPMEPTGCLEDFCSAKFAAIFSM